MGGNTWRRGTGGDSGWEGGIQNSQCKRVGYDRGRKKKVREKVGGEEETAGEKESKKKKTREEERSPSNDGSHFPHENVV